MGRTPADLVPLPRERSNRRGLLVRSLRLAHGLRLRAAASGPRLGRGGRGSGRRRSRGFSRDGGTLLGRGLALVFGGGLALLRLGCVGLALFFRDLLPVG